MNLPGWNEQPDSDQLTVQNKQLRKYYTRPCISRPRANANGWLIISERQKLNSLQQSEFHPHTIGVNVKSAFLYISFSTYGIGMK